MTVAAICRQLGISRSAYYCRIRRGWDREHVTGQPRYQHRPRAAANPDGDLNAVMRGWRR